VVDRDGWIWVFLGDAATAGSPPTIPAELFPFADRDFRRILGKFFWNANYERVLENALDFAHAPFVHAGAFGNPDEPEVPKLKIEEYECGASAMAILKPNPPAGLWKFLVSKKVIGIETKTGFIFPNLTFLQVTLPFGKLIIWSAHIPIDSDNTTTKWMNFRSFFTGKWADRDANDRTMAIFQQDRPIVESQRPQIIPDRLDAELHVPADALQLKYRQWRKKAEAN
jgi:phenylpropionate dioxygenase-like ring-hydroxylating dioxygenase large terminal subunit